MNLENLTIFARGARGGSSFSGSRSTSTTSKPTTTKSTTTTKPAAPKPTPAPAPKPATAAPAPAPAPKTSTASKPSTTTTTAPKPAEAKRAVPSTKKPVNTQYASSKGIVGTNGYVPRYSNGYVPPYGSTVYHRDHDFIDYLPWIYLFSQDSPQHAQEVIIQPDGKEIQAQPVKEGMDGLVILNWVLLILIIAGIIGGILYGVNKLTSKNNTPKPSGMYV